jgi:uncharacterized protein
MLTQDREPGTSTRFYTTEQLGPKRSKTPEGFLLCEEVPIARTGLMMYAPGEVPIDPGPDGLIRVTRDEEEVFRPEFIASFVGKPVVNDHPPTHVTPENFRKYTVGVVLNPRRGTGIYSDCIVADLLIQDPEAIQAVEDGKREVSCGYNAEYEDTAVGAGKQYNMVGNHVALVDQGRCGSRCAIRDHDATLGAPIMATADGKSFFDAVADRMRAAFRTKDEKAFEEAMKEASEAGKVVTVSRTNDETHFHIHAGEGVTGGPSSTMGGGAPLSDARRMSDADIEERFNKNEKEMKDWMKSVGDSLEEIKKKLGGEEAGDQEIEGKLKEEAPPGTSDKAAKATDSMYLEDSYQDTLAAAEILAPGVRAPVFDKAAPPKKTYDAICKLRRNALDVFYNTGEGRSAIDDIMGSGRYDPDHMTCDAIRAVFKSAAAVKRVANNNRRSTSDQPLAGNGGGTGVKSKQIRTPADLNKRLQEFYS